MDALPKPGRIFGRDREWRSLADFVADDRPEATLGVVSGRRRQGKTYLLRSLAEATDGFFFEAVQAAPVTLTELRLRSAFFRLSVTSIRHY